MDVGSGLHEVAKYVVAPIHMGSKHVFQLLVNAQGWSALPADLKPSCARRRFHDRRKAMATLGEKRSRR